MNDSNSRSTVVSNASVESPRSHHGVNRRWLAIVVLVLGLSFGFASNAAAQTAAEGGGNAMSEVSDAALVRSLPGFENGYANVNGVQLHYVAGGKGQPLVLLPGWPETWWEFHLIMPTLATRYHVIAVDLRGMGGSSKPQGGYDKKNMAEDIYELVRLLGYDKVNVAGHDIGSMVAFSFAANHPNATLKIALLDVPHPDEFFTGLKMLPEPGKFGDKIDDEHPGYPWWFAFHQVKGLPETVLDGRFQVYQNFLIDYLIKDPKSIGPHDRAVYAAAYATPDAIRAGDAWYQAFPQDIVDCKTYKKLEMPVLGLGSTGYDWLKGAVTPKATHFTLVRIENSGHFMQEEQPEVVAKLLAEFFK
ncbi:MAG TPA: alpha/beta hydrolase [Xanthomonadaceae bacterium]|jgi:pimeloyl-ACP methyl ester carboxylesterase|nr:alpha/beta hydrolase [Xanthomonadaceae bacterium]